MPSHTHTSNKSTGAKRYYLGGMEHIAVTACWGGATRPNGSMCAHPTSYKMAEHTSNFINFIFIPSARAPSLRENSRA